MAAINTKTKEMNPRDCTDISIDCESLGINYCAPVLAIGAVQFNVHTGAFGKKFYVEITMRSAIRGAERGINPDTIYWWMKQSPTAAARLFDDSDVARERKLVMAEGLHQLSDFVRSSGSPRVWAKGPMQDIAWLEHAYDQQAVGLTPPWGYNNVRDVRTIAELATMRGAKIDQIKFEGVEHNALDDAVHQAKQVMASWWCLAPTEKKGVTLKQNDSAEDDEF